MARKSNDSELRETWQAAAAAGDDGIRALVQRVVQQVLEAEMTSFLSAESYERTPGRRGYRNGYKPRLLKTRVGELELLVPKDRDGEFQTELFERYQRSEKALVLAIMQMYVIIARSFFGCTLGEWAFDIQLGKSEDQMNAMYPLKVIARSLIVTVTGLVLLPLVSLIMGEDVAGLASGTQLYEQK